MSIKERVRAEVEKIVARGHQINTEVIAFVKEDYEKTLDDVGKGMETIGDATREYLDGVEEGLKAAGHEAEKLVHKSAEALVDVSRQLGDRGMEAARRSAIKAKASLNEALDKTKGSMDNVEDRIRNRMTDAYGAFREVSDKGQERLEAVGRGIKAYADRKKTELNSDAKAALHKTTDRSRVLAQELAASTEKHSKELLSHSLKKTADWLAKLADKIKPD